MSNRLDSPYLSDNDTLTRTDGTPTGTTPGEMTISSSNSAPTTEASAHFDIAGTYNSQPAAAPRALSIGASISGTGPVVFRLGFWNPTTEKWYITSGFRVLGAAALADDTNYADGNAYFPSCPRWATKGYIYVPNLSGSITVVVSKDAP